VVPPPAPSPSREPSQGARLSLREQLDRIGNRALVSPVPGPYDAGQAGEGSGREATVALESRAHEYAAYLEKVKRRVEWVWGYPRLARELGLSGKVIIEFTILRDGGLGPLRVVDSSGVSILDDAAVEAIRRAAPYAPLPEAMGLESRTILASFEYHVGAVRLPGGP
jgi:protein TonB